MRTHLGAKVALISTGYTKKIKLNQPTAGLATLAIVRGGHGLRTGILCTRVLVSIWSGISFRSKLPNRLPARVVTLHDAHGLGHDLLVWMQQQVYFTSRPTPPLLDEPVLCVHVVVYQQEALG